MSHEKFAPFSTKFSNFDLFIAKKLEIQEIKNFTLTRGEGPKIVPKLSGSI
jgi:hypothetical protein